MPIHVFIQQVLSDHLLCDRNYSGYWGYSRETDCYFHEANILVRRDRQYIVCQMVIKLMEKNAAGSGVRDGLMGCG